MLIFPAFLRYGQEGTHETLQQDKLFGCCYQCACLGIDCGSTQSPHSRTRLTDKTMAALLLSELEFTPLTKAKVSESWVDIKGNEQAREGRVWSEHADKQYLVMHVDRLRRMLRERRARRAVEVVLFAIGPPFYSFPFDRQSRSEVCTCNQQHSTTCARAWIPQEASVEARIWTL